MWTCEKITLCKWFLFKTVSEPFRLVIEGMKYNMSERMCCSRNRAYGAMDNASDYGSKVSRFESWQVS